MHGCSVYTVDCKLLLTNIDDGWIWTRVFWLRNQPLCQLWPNQKFVYYLLPLGVVSDAGLSLEQSSHDLEGNMLALA